MKHSDDEIPGSGSPQPAARSFNLLGPLEVLRADGERINRGGRQPRLVLGRLLVAQGRVVPADALVDMLWGQRPPDSAGGTLQTYVSRLRRALGPNGSDLLRFGSAGYLLDVDAAQVDAREFERLADEGSRALTAGEQVLAVSMLRQALSLWRGEVLGGEDADFVRTAAARWQERRLAATEDLYDAELRIGRAAAVVADLTDAVAASPLRERLRGLLALALYRAGRQADALSVLDRGRRLLADELGLEPSRELVELQGQILSQDSTLDLPPAGERQFPADAAAGKPGAEVPHQVLVPGVRQARRREEPLAGPDGDMIGRAAERQTLEVIVTEALGGDGCRHIIIEGEPGIGKTRLAQEVLRHAHARGAVSFSAATLESGAAPAFGPWLQIFRAAGQQRSSLPDTARQMLEGHSQVVVGAAPRVVAAALADTVADSLTAMAADHGVVILLEDLQWADPASLDLLSSLAPRLQSARVLLVSTVRELEVGRDDAVVDALAQLTRQDGTRRISLRGLSLAETGELLNRSAGGRLPDDVVVALHSRSEGNPFFTTELARMITEQGHLGPAAVREAAVPNGVRDVLRRRVGRLPVATARLMEVAAVLGRQVDLDLLAGVADRGLDDCLDDLEPALLTRLLEVPATAPGAVRFTHALVRESLAEGMSPLRRARLHLTAADGILARVGENDDTAEIVADHLWHATAVGAGARAAGALERAAQVALKRQALVSAESLLDRAACLYRGMGEQGSLSELGVLRQLSFVGAALHGYALNADSAVTRRARVRARSNDRPDILLDMIWAEWAGCDTGGQPDRGERLVQEAEALVAGRDDPLLLGGVASMRAFAERHVGRMQSSYEHMTRAVRYFADSGEAREAGFYLNGFITSLGYRHWAGAMTRGLDRAAIELDYLAQELPFGRIVISLFGAAAAMSVGDEQCLRVFVDRMMAADPHMLLSFWSSAAELYNSVSLLQRGELEEGLALLAKGRQHIAEGGSRTTLAGVYAAAAQALASAGAVDESQRLLADARTELAQTAELAYQPLVELAAAHVASASGDRNGASRLLDLAASLAIEHGSLGVLDRIRREGRLLARYQSAL